MCGRYISTHYDETDRHLARSEEHNVISLLTFQKTKPSKEGAIHNHLLKCNTFLSFPEFTVLSNGNNKIAPKNKVSLNIKRDKLI